MNKKYDFLKFDKSEIYTKQVSRPLNCKTVFNSSCVDYGDELSKLNRKKNAKKNAKEDFPQYVSVKKTPEELKLLRAKMEYLEKIARGEIELTEMNGY